MTTDDAPLDFAIPDEMPVLPLREFVVFPYMVLPLFISRERSIAAVEDALAGDRLLLLTAQRNAELEEPEPDDLHAVGTVAMVMRILRLPDGRVKALVQGLSKARIETFVENDPAVWAQVSGIAPDEEEDWCVEAEALMRTVRGRVEELLPLKNLPPEVLSITANVHEAGASRRPGRLEPEAAHQRGAGGARSRRSDRAAAQDRLVAASRTRRLDDAGRDPIPGEGRDVARSARALSA